MIFIIIRGQIPEILWHSLKNLAWGMLVSITIPQGLKRVSNHWNIYLECTFKWYLKKSRHTPWKCDTEILNFWNNLSCPFGHLFKVPSKALSPQGNYVMYNFNYFGKSMINKGYNSLILKFNSTWVILLVEKKHKTEFLHCFSIDTIF